MMLFDSHAHYDDPRFEQDLDTLLPSMEGMGGKYITNVGTDLETSRFTAKLCEKYPFIWGAVGFHPQQAKDADEQGFEEIGSMLSLPKIKALGEIGLDYYYDRSERSVQREVFARQLDIAYRMGMPVIVHEREACKEVLDIIKASPCRNGVIHCFSGSTDTAREYLNLGFYISFTGVVTYKNARLAPIAAAFVPDDRIMAETDCPYLTPVPFRGKRNDSGYLKYTVARIAEARGITFEHAAQMTYENACRFFGIDR